MASKKNQKTNNSSSFFQSNTIWIGLIVVFTFLLFFNSIHNDFVTYDDPVLVVDNTDIRNLSFENLKLFFTKSYAAMYQPIVMITYAVEVQMFGLNPKAFHFINLLFHLTNIILVFYFILLFSKKVGLAAFVALFFAIHPMHVESVAWVTERKDVVYTLFFLISLIYYLKYNENKTETKYYIYSLVAFLLSLFSKSAAVVLPVVIVLIDYYQKNLTKKVILEKIPFFTLSLLFGIVSLFTQESAIEGINKSYPLFDRIFLVSYAISFYLIKFFVPFQLSVLHPYPEKQNGFLPPEYYLSILVILAIIILILRSKDYKKELIFGLLFFLITISLVIQLLPVGQAIAAERYTYVPYIGLLYIVGNYYYHLKLNKPILFKKLSTIFITGYLFFILFFSVTTSQRINIWKNSMNLYNDIIEKYPWHFYGYLSRGNFNIIVKQYNDALKDINKAIELRPTIADCYNSRANARYNLKDYSGALEDFNKVLSINPNYQLAFQNRASLRNELNDMKGALEDMSTLLKMVPNYGYGYYLRGNMYLKINQKDKACIDWKKADEFNYPDAKKALEVNCLSTN